MIALIEVGDVATGDLPGTATHAARCWTFARTPGAADGRLGNLTIEVLFAQPRSGKVESATYALEDGGPLPGLVGHRFWLTKLTDPAAEEVYEVVVGPLGRCGCPAGQHAGRKATSCKHRDALADMAARGVIRCDGLQALAAG